MEHVTVEAADPDDVRRTACRRLGEGLETAHVAVNHYRVPPGGGLPGGLHAHADQEEAFVVLAGTATFETLDGRVTVESGEAIGFAPGEFQSGVNERDAPLVVLALGAPAGSADVRLPFACPNCGYDSIRLGVEDHPTFGCPDCGAEFVPAPCPTCGSDELHATTDDENEPVVACRACGAVVDRPPMEG
jgi:mannose-6-phosphate isomerase-like protein (cupin superfamily)